MFFHVSRWCSFEEECHRLTWKPSERQLMIFTPDVFTLKGCMMRCRAKRIQLAVDRLSCNIVYTEWLVGQVYCIFCRNSDIWQALGTRPLGLRTLRGEPWVRPVFHSAHPVTQVSNYARKWELGTKRSQHNQIYWQGKPYAAYGNGAASFVNWVRASRFLAALG